MEEKRYDSQGNELWTGEYERVDGRYMYRYTQLDGEVKYAYAQRLQQLRLKEAKISCKHSVNILLGMRQVTLNNQYELWIASKVDIRENTRQDYRYMYETYVREGFGKRNIEDITTLDIKNFYIQLMHNQRLTVETISHLQNIIFQIFQMAKDSNMILTNPAERATKQFVRKRSKHTSGKKGLSKAEREAFVTYLEEKADFKRWYSVFFFMMYTGLRVGELCCLRWQDIDFKKKVLYVNHAMSYYRAGRGKATYHIGAPKTPASYRMIPLSQKVMQALEWEKKYQEENGILCKSEVDGFTDFVFLNRFGKHFDQTSLNRALKRIVLSYNVEAESDGEEHAIMLPHITNHILRHTCARMLCEAGVNPKVVQRIMGHSDIETTMMIYTEVGDEYIWEEYVNKLF